MDKVIEEALGKGIVEKILILLFEKDPLSYKQISEKLSIDYATLKKTMIRNKDYFQEDSKEGKIKIFKLSQFGEKFIKEKIDNYEKKQEALTKSAREEGERLKNTEELAGEIKTIIKNVNFVREDKSICFDFKEIVGISHTVASELLDNPDKIIEIFELSFEDDYKILFKNLPESEIISIEKLRQEHLNRLVMVECRSVSLSNVRPIIRNIKFECPSCGTIISILQNESFVRKPQRCSCGRRGNFRLISKEMVDAANVMLEDLQEKTENPNLQRIRCLIQEHLTKPENLSIFTPGNEIRMIGILREVPIFRIGKQSISLGFVFEVLSAELFEPEVNIDNFSKEDIEKIKQLAKDIDEKGMNEINASFAPDIYGYKQIKNSLIFQLCNRKNDPDKSTRNKPNILLMGDPGIAKSVLAKFSIAITPGSREAVGGGSSAVGITASVVKEEENLGGYRVEPGALILAKEILLIDELNNLSDEDKPKLQEGMGQQSVTINKANLHVKLRVTAGVLATANPKHGSFKSNETIISQFNIPSPIINRFDEIFTMKDNPEEKRDREIADKMIKRERGRIKPKYDPEFLKKFFVYVRNFCQPEIDDDISNKLQELYVKIRKQKTEDLIINPRFIEALTRLIKASAKIRLSNKIKDKDIKRALEVLNKTHFQTSEYSKFNFSETPSTLVSRNSFDTFDTNNDTPNSFDTFNTNNTIKCKVSSNSDKRVKRVMRHGIKGDLEFTEKPTISVEKIPKQLQDNRLEEEEELNKEVEENQEPENKNT